MSQVQLLYRLQQVDDEIREKRQRLSEVLQAQKETETLLSARRQAETAVAELQKWQTCHRDLTLELDGLNSKAKRSEDRLYSGQVKNPKELSDLQNEIESLARRRDALEDEILEAMIMIEDSQAEKGEADESLAKIITAWESSQSDLKREQHELALRLHELGGLRQKQVGSISADFLAEYQSIGSRRGGVAVAGLRHNICQGCRLNVSVQKMREANEGKLVYCGSCGRILNPI